MGQVDYKLVKRAFASVGRSFFGGAVDNRESAPMGKGHNNDGKPFDLATACYLRPIFDEYDRAVRNHAKLELVMKAGVKTMKSFVLETTACDHVCNRIGDVAIFFGTGDLADTVSTTRIMDDFMGIPRFKKKLSTISNAEGRARHQITNGAVKFPDKTLFLIPANLSETQQKNLGFVGLQDAFLTADTGMIAQIISRTTQYPDAIIVIESQGGEEHFDFDDRYEKTNQGELHVVCPICGKPHVFNWKAFDESSMTRGEDFIPTPPLSIPSLDRPAWIETNRPIMLAEGRKVAGFQRGQDEQIKNKDGSYNEKAIIEQTHFRCFHCDGIWHDDGEFGPTRIALDKSSHYVAANSSAPPGKVGFNFPQWINRRLAWGTMMVEKLNAHRNASEFGNYEPLKIWWQKTAARTWSQQIITAKQRSVTVGSYDPEQLKELIANAHSVNMAVDCQEDGDHKEKTGVSITGWFWFVVRVYDKEGNSKQLSRGYCRSWGAWMAVQKKWGIPNDRVMIDCIFDPMGVRNKAIECRSEIVPVTPHPIFKLAPQVTTWNLLQAITRQNNFKHKDGKERAWSEEMRDGGYVIDEKTGRPKWITVPKIMFNKNPIRLQVDALYSSAPGMVKFEVLSRDHLRLPDGSPDLVTMKEESGKRTYENQMSAQQYNMEKHKYDELHPDDHYYWCEQALVVRAGMDGLLGMATENVAI